MLSTLFPASFNNSFPARRPALWIFGILTLIRLVMSLNSIIIGYTVATRADGIPLAQYPTAASNAIVSLFAIWGLAQVMLCGLSVLALIRYRAMVPMLFALTLLEYVLRKLILHFLPFVRSATVDQSVVTLLLPTLMISGLALCFWKPRTEAFVSTD